MTVDRADPAAPVAVTAIKAWCARTAISTKG